ncbi:small heat shock protein, chloroplastic-like [Bidens hawaiensis]|uniref:small heat shock protein, chloroplastic-like n=1 Tax=Bidens hawaiensis TaxID=980011 RepID=UPI00404A7D3F
MRCRLNAAETAILGPGCNPGRWTVRQNTEALLLQRRISGSGYEDLDVCVKPSFDAGKEPAVLIIYREIESSTYFSKNEFYGRYNMRIDLQCDLYDTDAINIEQNSQVLMITVPKLKPERIDVVALKCEWETSYNGEKMTPKKLKLNLRI